MIISLIIHYHYLQYMIITIIHLDYLSISQYFTCVGVEQTYIVIIISYNTVEI